MDGFGWDVIGGVIFYKNVFVFIGYYVGIGFLLFLIGFFFGFVVIVLGLFGIVWWNKFLEVKGLVYVIVVIICGFFLVVVYGLIVIGIVIGVMNV